MNYCKNPILFSVAFGSKKNSDLDILIVYKYKGNYEESYNYFGCDILSTDINHLKEAIGSRDILYTEPIIKGTLISGNYELFHDCKNLLKENINANYLGYLKKRCIDDLHSSIYTYPSNPVLGLITLSYSLSYIYSIKLIRDKSENIATLESIVGLCPTVKNIRDIIRDDIECQYHILFEKGTEIVKKELHKLEDNYINLPFIHVNTPKYLSIIEKIKQKLFIDYENVSNSKLKEYIRIFEDALKESINGEPVIRNNNILSEITCSHNLNEENIKNEFKAIINKIPLTGHALMGVNLNPPTNLLGVASKAVSSILMPNNCNEDTSGTLVSVENKIIAYLSNLVGYNNKESFGYNTFSGTGTLIYSLKVAIGKNKNKTNSWLSELKFIIPLNSHEAIIKSLFWLGFNESNIVKIPLDSEQRYDIIKFQNYVDNALLQNEIIAYVYCSFGSTSGFVFENISQIHQIINRYKHISNIDTHIHADSVSGWIYTFFNNYLLAENKLGIPGNILNLIIGNRNIINSIRYTDSCSFDFHKTGFSTYTNSFILFKNHEDKIFLRTNKSADIPHLSNLEYLESPVKLTLETSRSGSSIIESWFNLYSIGENGFRSIVVYLKIMSNKLRRSLESTPNFSIVNNNGLGFDILFRIIPDLESKNYSNSSKYDEYNKRFYKYISNSENYLKIKVGYTRAAIYNGTNKVPAIRIYLLSLHQNNETVSLFSRKLIEAKMKFDESETD